jgi:hypothetical protein
MATSQQFLVCDSSTYANFAQWASAISAQFAAFTWAQSTDTGQIMWTGLTISAVSMSGSNATYTYAALTGLPLAVGRALTVTACTNAGNNKTVVITSFTGTTSGTFTVVNASGVAESGSAGVVTIQTTAPGAAAFFYEIWTPNDGLTNFFVKVEYGNYSGTNSPDVRITLSSLTNGAGTPAGLISTVFPIHNNTITPVSTTTPFECDFSGAPGRFGAMMWRNASSPLPLMFVIERSLNSVGAYTGAHVTLVLVGNAANGNPSGWPSMSQQSLLFGVGPGPTNTRSSGGNGPTLAIRPPIYNGVTTALNNNITFDTVSPQVGYFDYPLTAVGLGLAIDFVEGVTFTATVYGSARTYMISRTGNFMYLINGLALMATGMRYD